MGYVPFAMGHYIETTGEETLTFLEMFRSNRLADVSLSQWLALTPAELVQAHLNLDAQTMVALSGRKDKPIVVKGRDTERRDRAVTLTTFVEASSQRGLHTRLLVLLPTPGGWLDGCGLPPGSGPDVRRAITTPGDGSVNERHGFPCLRGSASDLARRFSAGGT